MNELLQAIRAGSTERIVALLSTGGIDIDEGTPLIAAAMEDHSSIVRILLNKGADTSLLSINGITALHVSAGKGHLTVTKLLLRAGADLEAKMSTGSTPLHMAAEEGHSEVVRVLIEAGANPNSRELDRLTPLYRAAEKGQAAVAKLLVKAGADLDTASAGGFTPLHMTAERGHSEMMGVLIEAGANPNSRAFDGSTPLYVAASRGQAVVTRLLVIAGADLEAATSTTGFTPLHIAAMKGHSEVMRMLIEAGGDPNSRAADSSTPLFTAALRGNVDTIKVLLRAKADPLLIVSTPCSVTVLPLDAAAAKGHSEVVRELIQQLGIEVCGGANGGVNALRWAAGRQHLEIMGMLTNAGVVDNGEALMAAAENGREASVKFLLKQQMRKEGGVEAAYVNFRDFPDGRTPILAAVGSSVFSSARIMRLLIDAGADTASVVSVLHMEGVEIFNLPPLLLALRLLLQKHSGESDATEKQQWQGLEAVRRLLLRMDAVHAVSWLWARDMPSVAHAAEESEMPSAPLISVLPVLRRRAARPRVLLAALFRQSNKP